MAENITEGKVSDAGMERFCKAIDAWLKNNGE